MLLKATWLQIGLRKLHCIYFSLNVEFLQRLKKNGILWIVKMTMSYQILLKCNIDLAILLSYKIQSLSFSYPLGLSITFSYKNQRRNCMSPLCIISFTLICFVINQFTGNMCWIRPKRNFVLDSPTPNKLQIIYAVVL